MDGWMDVYLCVFLNFMNVSMRQGRKRKKKKKEMTIMPIVCSFAAVNITSAAATRYSTVPYYKQD